MLLLFSCPAVLGLVCPLSLRTRQGPTLRRGMWPRASQPGGASRAFSGPAAQRPCPTHAPFSSGSESESARLSSLPESSSSSQPLSSRSSSWAPSARQAPSTRQAAPGLRGGSPEAGRGRGHGGCIRREGRGVATDGTHPPGGVPPTSCPSSHTGHSGRAPLRDRWAWREGGHRGKQTPASIQDRLEADPSPPPLHRDGDPTQPAVGLSLRGPEAGQPLTSSPSLSSVSSLLSCCSFALFLKASFSGLRRSEGQARLGGCARLRQETEVAGAGRSVPPRGPCMGSWPAETPAALL